MSNMPTPAKYSYSIQASFPNHAVDSSRLLLEVRGSTIVAALERIDTGGGVCDIWFKDTLSAADEATLNGIVASHSGERLPDLTQFVRLDGPAEADKKPIVVVSPATSGMLSWLTGRADGPEGRGRGPQLRIDFDEPGEKMAEFQFSEPIEVNDGQVWWRPAANWGPDDEFEFGVRMPAADASATPGTGNANAVTIAPGVDLYVPAAGNGSHTVDLASAAPVRAPNRDGYWDVDDVTGVVTPANQPGSAGWNLLSVPITAYLVRGISTGHPLCVWDIDVYKTEWIHPNWRLLLVVRKTTPGAGTIGGWMLTFRRNVVG